MAKDVKEPKPTDKGKGKAKAADEPKDEKPVLNGKKEDGKDDDKKDGMWLTSFIHTFFLF